MKYPARPSQGSDPQAWLFEPMSLQVVNDQVYVYGRDGLVRLNDVNGDGEADFYENFSDLSVQTLESREFPLSMGLKPGGGFYLSRGGALDNGPRTAPSIAPGFRADLITLDLTSPRLETADGALDIYSLPWLAESGVADVAFENDIEALLATRDFFDFLPLSNRHDLPTRPTADPFDRQEDSLDTLIPDSAAKPYDMHELIRKTVDEGDFFELQPAHAGNIIIGFGRIGALESLLTSNTQYRSISGFPFEMPGLVALLILFVIVLFRDIPAKWLLGFWFVTQFFTNPNEGVAWVAHVGGFAFGALVAAFPNTGFMGVPLLVALLGAAAAGPAILTILIVGQQGYTGGINGMTDLRTLLGWDIRVDSAKYILYFVCCFALLGMLPFFAMIGLVLLQRSEGGALGIGGGAGGLADCHHLR